MNSRNKILSDILKIEEEKSLELKKKLKMNLELKANPLTFKINND